MEALSLRRASAHFAARVRGTVPRDQRERLTILGGLTLGGLSMCPTVEGVNDAAVIRAVLAHSLVPVLRPAQIGVPDNLRAHPNTRAWRLIEATDCALRYLPPYSPDFNAIEQAWNEV